MRQQQKVAAVVLGARVDESGHPSPAFERRLDAAAALWTEGAVLGVCVVGGVDWGGGVESTVGREHLEAAGVPRSAIRVDPCSRSTRGNARSAYALLGDVPILVVTDGYHMRRAMRCFKRWFAEAHPHPTPSSRKLRSWVREALAWVAEWLRKPPAIPGTASPAWTARRMLPNEAPACAAVRRVVFQLGQRVPLEIERDGRDDEALHWVLRHGPSVVGTARARGVGDGFAKVERVAVLGCYRGRGAGRTLMEAVHRGLVDAGFTKAKLHAQQDVIGFYEALGYAPQGDVFFEADIPHVSMCCALTR